MPGLMERKTSAPAIPQIWRSSLDESAVSVDWSASGSWLAAASASGTVCLFDATNGECIQNLSAHRFGATQAEIPVEFEERRAANSDALADFVAQEAVGAGQARHDFLLARFIAERVHENIGIFDVWVQLDAGHGHALQRRVGHFEQQKPAENLADAICHTVLFNSHGITHYFD